MSIGIPFILLAAGTAVALWALAQKQKLPPALQERADRMRAWAKENQRPDEHRVRTGWVILMVSLFLVAVFRWPISLIPMIGVLVGLSIVVKQNAGSSAAALAAAAGPPPGTPASPPPTPQPPPLRRQPPLVPLPPEPESWSMSFFKTVGTLIVFAIMLGGLIAWNTEMRDDWDRRSRPIFESGKREARAGATRVKTRELKFQASGRGASITMQETALPPTAPTLPAAPTPPVGPPGTVDVGKRLKLAKLNSWGHENVGSEVPDDCEIEAASQLDPAEYRYFVLAAPEFDMSQPHDSRHPMIRKTQDRAVQLVKLRLEREYPELENVRLSLPVLERLGVVSHGPNDQAFRMAVDVAPERLEKVYNHHLGSMRTWEVAKAFAGAVLVLGGLGILLRIGTGLKPKPADKPAGS